MCLLWLQSELYFQSFFLYTFTTLPASVSVSVVLGWILYEKLYVDKFHRPRPLRLSRHLKISASLLGIYTSTTWLVTTIFSFCYLVFMFVFVWSMCSVSLPCADILPTSDWPCGPREPFSWRSCGRSMCVVMCLGRRRVVWALIPPHFSLQGVNKDSYLILDKLPAE